MPGARRTSKGPSWVLVEVGCLISGIIGEANGESTGGRTEMRFGDLGNWVCVGTHFIINIVWASLLLGELCGPA